MRQDSVTLRLLVHRFPLPRLLVLGLWAGRNEQIRELHVWGDSRERERSAHRAEGSAWYETRENLRKAYNRTPIVSFALTLTASTFESLSKVV